MATIGLSHTLNVDGELGSFVNPHTCSCATCVNYLAQRGIARNPPPPRQPFAGLPHTLNTRGELGMYADPQNCGCITCVDLVAPPQPPPLRAAPGAAVPAAMMLQRADGVPLGENPLFPMPPAQPMLQRADAVPFGDVPILQAPPHVADDAAADTLLQLSRRLELLAAPSVPPVFSVLLSVTSAQRDALRRVIEATTDPTLRRTLQPVLNELIGRL